MHQRTLVPLGLLLIALLSACGGGGPNNNPGAPATEQAPAIEQPSPPATLTGRFMDGPVSGLRYVTPSQSGFTNDAGEFAYLAGETVSFYVGDILIGEAAAAETITPFDLAGIEPPMTSKEINRTLLHIRSNTLATPMDIVTNIAVLLQTLDEDGDPANGQEIPTAIHKLAAGSSINIAQKYWIFRKHRSFNELIASGRTAGLWSGQRAIRHPLIALDTLYSGLNLTPTIEAVATVERDALNDGAVELRLTYTYDLNGKLILLEYDDNDDGIADSDGAVISHNTSTSNTTGRLVISEYDYDGDGVLDARYSSTYDAFDYLILGEQDTDANGTLDSRTTYSYDEFGNNIIEERDHGADGTVDIRYTKMYAADGKLMLSEYDDGADGTVDGRTTYAYDINNHQTLMEYEANGVIAYRSTSIYSLNSDGVVTLREADDNGDGITDIYYFLSYDANGNLTQVDDIDTDGKILHRTSITYVVTNKWLGTEW